ncbi:KEOPS complex subunit Cgi121 [Thermoplasma sp.]|uniref:KEOPS complex subunit Cgi121 n=1 Tax=Thermoplasma sp. TaxID=1973142 RepID=UPI00345C2701
MQLKVKFFSSDNVDIPSLINFVRSRISVFQPIKIGCIPSQVALESAIERASRRTDHGSRVRDTGILILMYLSGCGQIQDAVSRCGISPGERSFALVYEDQADITELMHRFPRIREIPHDIPADQSDDMIFEKMSYVDSMLD